MGIYFLLIDNKQLNAYLRLVMEGTESSTRETRQSNASPTFYQRRKCSFSENFVMEVHPKIPAPDRPKVFVSYWVHNYTGRKTPSTLSEGLPFTATVLQATGGSVRAVFALISHIEERLNQSLKERPLTRMSVEIWGTKRTFVAWVRQAKSSLALTLGNWVHPSSVSGITADQALDPTRPISRAFAIIRHLSVAIPRSDHLKKARSATRELDIRVSAFPNSLEFGDIDFDPDRFARYGLQCLKQARHELDQLSDWQGISGIWVEVATLSQALEHLVEKVQIEYDQMIRCWESTLVSERTPTAQQLHDLWLRLADNRARCEKGLVGFVGISKIYFASLQGRVAAQITDISHQKAISEGMSDLYAYLNARLLAPLSQLRQGLVLQLRYILLSSDHALRTLLQSLFVSAKESTMGVAESFKDFQHENSLPQPTEEPEYANCVRNLASVETNLAFCFRNWLAVSAELTAFVPQKKEEPVTPAFTRSLARLSLAVIERLNEQELFLDQLLSPLWQEWDVHFCAYLQTLPSCKRAHTLSRIADALFNRFFQLIVITRTLQFMREQWNRRLQVTLTQVSKTKKKRRVKRRGASRIPSHLTTPAIEAVPKAEPLARIPTPPSSSQRITLTDAIEIAQSRFTAGRAGDLLTADALIAEYQNKRASLDTSLGLLSAVHRLVEITLKGIWEAEGTGKLGNLEYAHHLQNLTDGLFRHLAEASSMRPILDRHTPLIARLSAAHQFVDFGHQSSALIGNVPANRRLKELYRQLTGNGDVTVPLTEEWVEPSLSLCCDLIGALKPLESSNAPSSTRSAAVSTVDRLDDSQQFKQTVTSYEAAGMAQRLVRILLDDGPDSHCTPVLRDLEVRLVRLMHKWEPSSEEKERHLLATYWEGTDLTIRSLQGALLAALLYRSAGTTQPAHLKNDLALEKWFRNNDLLTLSELVKAQWNQKPTLKAQAVLLPDRQHPRYRWLNQLHATLCYPRSQHRGGQVHELPAPLLALQKHALKIRPYIRSSDPGWNLVMGSKTLNLEALQNEAQAHIQQLEAEFLVPLLHLTLHVLAYGFIPEAPPTPKVHEQEEG